MLDTDQSTATPPATEILTPDDWRTRSRAHVERVRKWTTPHKKRRARQEPHPVYDFLFQYYMYSPAKLEAWHPSPGEAITDSPDARGRFQPPHYSIADGVIRHNVDGISERDRSQQRMVTHVLETTRRSPANFGCYGVHEWAMVYGGHEVRHGDITPLRLPQEDVDGFVESRPVACSHFDAFRFFAPDAKPLNRINLEWATRHEMEQPGCIHANMDLYRWAYTAMPWVGSDLLWDCFQLAADLRVLDMQASPYDLTSLGFAPVTVETPEGRSEYQRRQRELSERAQALRGRLIDAVALIGQPAMDQTARSRT